MLGAYEAIAQLATAWDDVFAKELLDLLEPMTENHERQHVCSVCGKVAAYFEESFAGILCDRLARWAQDNDILQHKVQHSEYSVQRLQGKVFDLLISILVFLRVLLRYLMHLGLMRGDTLLVVVF